jgi:predicted DNA-binding transcriptional regulator YafY
MNEISAKFKRQIEILGIAIRNTESFGTDDLAQMYGVERLTIKRDLQELRNNGIDVHSEGKRGVHLSRKIDSERLKRIVSSYLALSRVRMPIENASARLLKKHGEVALPIVVTIQKCIEDSMTVHITYESEHSRTPVQFLVGPVMIFEADGLWRLLAEHEGILKQFLLTKISAATPTDDHVKPVADELVEQVLRHSFRSWTGIERHRVRLKMSLSWANRLESRSLIGFERVPQQPAEFRVLEGTVNSLDEIGRWIVSQGGTVVALKPKMLIRRVKELARASLSAHKETSR